MDGFAAFVTAVIGLAMGLFFGTMIMAAADEGKTDQGYGWGRTFIAQTNGNIGQAVGRCRDHNHAHHDGSSAWLGGCVKGVHGDERR